MPSPLWPASSSSGGLNAIDAGALTRPRELEALGFLQLTLAVTEKISGPAASASSPRPHPYAYPEGSCPRHDRQRRPSEPRRPVRVRPGAQHRVLPAGLRHDRHGARAPRQRRVPAAPPLGEPPRPRPVRGRRPAAATPWVAGAVPPDVAGRHHSSSSRRPGSPWPTSTPSPASPATVPRRASTDATPTATSSR